LDLVTFNFNYHDTVHMGTDRARMNRAVFQALKPGGVYIVADHSAVAGAGTSVTKTLHRIEEAVVRKEVEAAGFRLVTTGSFLRSAGDPRDVPVFKNPVANDEFVLKFVKP
jgi:predicted methyltransferase